MKYCSVQFSTKHNKDLHRVTLLSILLASSVFFIIPLVNRVPKPEKKVFVRPVEVMTLEEEKKKEVLRPRKKSPRKYRISIPQQVERLVPFRIKAELSLDIPIDKGDFNLNFSSVPDFEANDFVFEMEQVDTIPRALVQIPPVYPIHAKQKQVEGRVILLCTVMSDGRVEEILIQKSNPSGIFDQSAIAAVKKWKFKAGTKNNVPVNVRVSIPLSFKLN